MASIPSSGFDREAFITAIHFAMTMGAAPSAEEQPQFHFPNTLVYNAPADGDDIPFDPSATVTSTPGQIQYANCAVEYFDAENQPTSFGLLAPARIAITLLDEDYQSVKDCPYVVIHGDRYDYRRTEPPSGLFDVGVYVMHFTATNET